MSVASPLKRSAEDAQLKTRPCRPRKSARTAMKRPTKADSEAGALARWSEAGRLSAGAIRALTGALYTTMYTPVAVVCRPISSGFHALWKTRRMLAPRGSDELILHTRQLTFYESPLSKPRPEAGPSNLTQSTKPPSSKPPPKQTNQSPTNLQVSSPSATPLFYPSPQVSQASSSSASSANTSRPSGAESSSTQTSIPNSPNASKPIYESTQSDSVRKVINRTNTDGLLSSAVVKRYKRKSHIFEGQHRKNVKEHLERLLYERTREMGYKSDFDTFRDYIQYRRRLEEIEKNNLNLSRAGSRAPTPILPQDDVDFFKRAVEKATKSLQSPKPPKPFSPSLEELSARTRFKNDRIFNRLHPKRKPIPDRLPSDAEREVRMLLQKRGVVSKAGREQVSDMDLARLAPGQWLNDEVINFYGQLIVERAAEAEAAKENQSGKVLNVHYFSTFFWPKLLSGYEKGRLAKWTKKVDIFSKDIIIMAINHGNAHWTPAAIDFRRKRIVSHDSMGFHRSEVYKALRTYLNEEHKNKKKKPFDFTGWEDYRSDTYPEQENGYDCGVFTCQTIEYLSRGEDEFNFTQQNMPYLRQRMMWEIGRARLGSPL